MTNEIVHGPSFATLKVRLSPGESIIAEAGSMVARSTETRMQVRLNANRKAGFLGTVFSLFVAFLRRMVGGETFFVNEFSTADPAGSVVMLAPRMSGQIVHRVLTGEKMLLWGGAFLACGSGVTLQLKWAGLRGLLSREGLFYIEASGSGDLFINAYGGIEEIDVLGSYVVDTGHLVAFEPQLDFEIGAPGGGMMGLFASGEGLVCRFSGNGKVLVQSRNVSALVDWISGYLP